MRGKDVVTQTAVELYQDQLNHAGTKWYVSRISHQFWLASLSGMLVSLILLLLVKIIILYGINPTARQQRGGSGQADGGEITG